MPGLLTNNLILIEYENLTIFWGKKFIAFAYSVPLGLWLQSDIHKEPRK